ncbi:hypothetical protein ES703_64283 [subsurface metagenome]
MGSAAAISSSFIVGSSSVTASSRCSTRNSSSSGMSSRSCSPRNSDAKEDMSSSFTRETTKSELRKVFLSVSARSML